MRQKLNSHRILVGKAEGRRRLGIPGYRWKDNIEMDLRDRMGLYGLEILSQAGESSDGLL
jgi:hypothetical protein